MKRVWVILMCTVVAIASLAQDVKLRHDSLCIYSTWQSLLDGTPDAILENPVETNFEKNNRVNFRCAGGKSKKNIDNLIGQAMILEYNLEDTTLYYVNCAWLNGYMTEGALRLGREGYLPMLFNDKMICVVLTEYKMATRYAIDGTYPITILYHLDFENRCVHEINPKYLLHLLEFYPDLRRRYEGRKHKDSMEVIVDYLNEYINRIAGDGEVPSVEEVLGENE